ncbi:hypothetical protein N7478_006791 [Penicillium angulare]|uniref:uncharacterized protein n=1 Tax=Penicillium angulare TaxID=116970 RepID=UPI002540FBCD|nr:uncharacterized protein N7478_006791 [Penicillium angulare]KAJ5281419.1 hypothetical protein N7478_006791 [Penicillium angulare]
MKFPSWTAGLVGAALLSPVVHAIDVLKATSLTPCSDDNVVGVNFFELVFTPGNSSALVEFEGTIEYQGKIKIEVELLVYGYSAIKKELDPCTLSSSGLGLCPIEQAKMTIPRSDITVAKSFLSDIPSIAYTVPDLDAIVQLTFKNYTSGETITCIETRISNDKTVDQIAVSWIVAVVTGLGLITTVVISILGHTLVATHLNFRTMLFLGFMQSQAIAGMAAVEFPPIVQSWTQTFQWTLGILHTSALQSIATWFQRATGGSPADLLGLLDDESVFLAKRSETTTVDGTEQTVRGIERVGFRADIESSNIFMTGYLFFYFVAVLIILAILFLRAVLPPLSRKFNNPRLAQAANATSEWQTFMRGSLYRVVSLGYPQMCVICMWELIQRDSPAEIVLAISMWLIMSLVLLYAGFRVFQRAKASKALNEHPAYTLYSDPVTLTKWGFLYINYRAQAYYFIIPVLASIVIRGMVTAFCQAAWIPQSIILLVLEAAVMVITIVVRPYMDRAANGFAITATVLNFLNALFMLIFSNVFNQPQMMTSILGVIWFLFNAVFTLALLIWLFIGFYYAFTLKEPDGKYKRLSENRESFRMSGVENRMTTELLPLEKTARGDGTDSRLGSRWNVDETGHAESNHDLNMSLSHQGSRYNLDDRSPTHTNEKIGGLPRSPVQDVLEPTLPLIPTSSDNSGRRSPLSPAFSHPSRR